MNPPPRLQRGRASDAQHELADRRPVLGRALLRGTLLHAHFRSGVDDAGARARRPQTPHEEQGREQPCASERPPERRARGAAHHGLDIRSVPPTMLRPSASNAPSARVQRGGAQTRTGVVTRLVGASSDPSPRYVISHTRDEGSAEVTGGGVAGKTRGGARPEPGPATRSVAESAEAPFGPRVWCSAGGEMLLLLGLRRKRVNGGGAYCPGGFHRDRSTRR